MVKSQNSRALAPGPRGRYVNNTKSCVQSFSGPSAGISTSQSTPSREVLQPVLYCAITINCAHPEVNCVAYPVRGLAPEGSQLIDSGLLTEGVETILSSRAPSTRKLYALKWRLFVSWCDQHQLNPVNCPVSSLLEFLQECLSTGLTPSTLKVYVAISTSHIPLDGASVGRHPLVSQFLCGARWLCWLRVPSCGNGSTCT